MSGPPSPLLVVLGATATGKTELAAAVAEAVGGEVLCVDATTVFRGLDVGTAKPPAELRARVPHHLLDVFDPRDVPTVADFVRLAEAAIDDVLARGRPPVLVGGSGMYLRCLLSGLAPSPADAALRARLEARERRRPGSLHRLVSRLDPPAALRTPAANLPRLVRALEHRLLTGRTLLADVVPWGRERWPTAKVGLLRPRPEREEAIRQRVDAMIAAGLVDEVRSLLEAGVPRTARSLRALGYREIALHLDGTLTLEQARERIVVATRRYAKRQDTWFRRERDVTWMASPTPPELPALVRDVILRFRQLQATTSTSSPSMI